MHTHRLFESDLSFQHLISSLETKSSSKSSFHTTKNRIMRVWFQNRNGPSDSPLFNFVKMKPLSWAIVPWLKLFLVISWNRKKPLYRSIKINFQIGNAVKSNFRRGTRQQPSKKWYSKMGKTWFAMGTKSSRTIIIFPEIIISNAGILKNYSKFWDNFR